MSLEKTYEDKPILPLFCNFIANVNWVWLKTEMAGWCPLALVVAMVVAADCCYGSNLDLEAMWSVVEGLEFNIKKITE